MTLDCWNEKDLQYMERYQSEVSYDPIKVFLISIFITLLPINALNAASFDCSKAVSQTEKAICADPTLSDLDLNLSGI